MKLISIDEVLRKADERYAAAKQAAGMDLRCAAPEALPRIQSDQAKAIAAVIVDEVNARLAALAGWEP